MDLSEGESREGTPAVAAVAKSELSPICSVAKSGEKAAGFKNIHRPPPIDGTARPGLWELARLRKSPPARSDIARALLKISVLKNETLPKKHD
jgi:hypothetical protein